MTNASPREKLRSLWLVILILLSTTTVAVSFAGSAAATNAPIEVAANDLDTTTVYHGEEVDVDVTGTDNEDFEVAEGETVFFYEVLGDGEIDLEDTYTVDGGTITVDTDIVDDAGQYAINNRSSYADFQTEFGVLTQEFDTEWAQDTVTESDDAVALSVTSNRDPEYNVTISADGLDYDELNATFVHPGSDLTEVTDPNHLPLDRLGFDREDGDGVEEMRNNGYITLNTSDATDFTADDEIVANFTNLDVEEGLTADELYEFNVTVTDTKASDVTTLRTGEKQATFGQELYTRAAGDLAEFSVSLGVTDEVWVQFEDPSSNFVDVLYLSDGDGDNEVTFTANTRLLGTDHANVDGLEDSDTEVVYYSNSDTVESHIHDQAVNGNGPDVSRATFYDGSVDPSNTISFSSYVNSVNGNSPTQQLPGPLQPTNYTLTVSNEGEFVAADGEPTVADEIGSTEFDLVQPFLRDVTTSTAPRGDANDAASIASLDDVRTERSEIAIRDRALVQYEATGITGAMATIDYIKNGDDIDEGLQEGYPSNVVYELYSGETDWRGEGLYFAFEGEEIPNRDPNELTLQGVPDTDVYALVEQQTTENNDGALEIVVNSDAEPFDDGLDNGEQFDTWLNYTAVNSAFSFTGGGPLGGAGGDDTVPAYPYFSADRTENVTAASAVTFVEPSASFANTREGTVQLAPAENALVSGRTNVAPNSTASVRVRLTPPDGDLPDEDPSFLAQDTVPVEADGSFSTELDLSNRVVGEEGYLQFTVGDETVETRRVVFRDIAGVQSPYFDVTLQSPDELASGESAEIMATITNTGDMAGTGELAIFVDGSTAVRGVFDLDRGEFRRLNHTVTADRRGIQITATSQNRSVNTTVTVRGQVSQDTTTPTTETVTTPENTSEPTQTTASTGATETTAPGAETVVTTSANGGGGVGFTNILAGVVLLGLLAGGVILVLRWRRV